MFHRTARFLPVVAVAAVLVSLLVQVEVSAQTVTEMEDVAFEDLPAVAHHPTRSQGAAPSLAPFSLVAASWDTVACSTLSMPGRGPACAEVEVRIRVRTEAGWGPWTPLEADDVAPDPEEAAAAAAEVGDDRTFSEPIWVGRADGLEVVVDGPDPAGADLTFHLAREKTKWQRAVRGGQAPADAQVRPNQPAIIERSAWTSRSPRHTSRYSGGAKRVVVHHTATANNYSRSDVPRQLRSIQAYHMDTRGWSDIAYNFMVDRFGRMWEARAGGIDEPIIGGHTQGFNTGSVGIAALGNFDTVSAPDEMVAAISELAGWRLRIDGADPEGTVRVMSYGSDRYPRGTWATFPVISGHRDYKSTSCPGANLYPKLRTIRDKAARIFPPVHGAVEAVHHRYGGVRVAGWAYEEKNGSPLRIEIQIDDERPVPTVTYVPRPDVVDGVSSRPLSSGFDVVLPTDSGEHDVCVFAVGKEGTRTRIGCRKIGAGWSPLSGDFDGDGKDDPVRWEAGTWNIHTSRQAKPDLVFDYGDESGVPIAGDWDGDGTDGIGFVRDGVWMLRNTATPGNPHITRNFGRPGDTPVAGDWTGDGTDHPGVIRGKRWYLADGPAAIAAKSFLFGWTTDQPIAGDWDGDGVDEPGVLRGRVWYLSDKVQAGNARWTIAFGRPGDWAVGGDWDGDRATEVGLLRTAARTFYFSDDLLTGVADDTLRFDAVPT